MQMMGYYREMLNVIDSLRGNLAGAQGTNARRGMIREARRAVKRIQMKAKHLIEDRVTRHTPLSKICGNRCSCAHHNILLIEVMALGALDAIDDLAPETRFGF
jgi:hypothetical protein